MMVVVNVLVTPVSTMVLMKVDVSSVLAKKMITQSNLKHLLVKIMKMEKQVLKKMLNRLRIQKKK